MKIITGLFLGILLLASAALGRESPRRASSNAQRGMVKIQLRDGRILYGAAVVDIYSSRGGRAVLQGNLEIITESNMLASIKNESVFNWSAKTNVETGSIYTDTINKIAIFIIDGFGTVSYLPAAYQDWDIPIWQYWEAVEQGVTVDGKSGILKISIGDPEE